MKPIIEIKTWFIKKTKWLVREEKKPKSNTTLKNMLLTDLGEVTRTEEETYFKTLSSRTDKEIDKGIKEIIKAREKRSPFLYKNIIPNPEKGLICTNEKKEKKSKDDDNKKEARKKGYMELSFEKALINFKDKTTFRNRKEALRITIQLEIPRIVNFLDDIQKLRIQNSLRVQSNERIFGIKDALLDYGEVVLKVLEDQQEKMLHQMLSISPYSKYYNWLTSEILGMGTRMAGAFIGKCGAPERFRSVSALWAYCGLHTVDNNDEGFGGHAARLESGTQANWNSFLKAKLLGVLPDTIVKSQTQYLGKNYPANIERVKRSVEARKKDPKKKIWVCPPRDKYKARHLMTLIGYKSRIQHKNKLIPEKDRYYFWDKDAKKYRELFQNRSHDKIDVFTKRDKPRGKMSPCDVTRRTNRHIDTMARRYMIKMLLIEILNKWRELEGYEPLLTYDEAKLRNGAPHGGLRNKKTRR